MKSLSPERVSALLKPYGADVPLAVCEKVSLYVDLLCQWNDKINLSAVRDPEQVVQRHFGEGFLLARALPAFETLLDLGSGAGFPGLPLALLHPQAAVTLAECHKKKAAFLREASSVLGVRTKVWAGRAEDMPATDVFDVVTLRAVDKMEEAMRTGAMRLQRGGTLAFFVDERQAVKMPEASWTRVESLPLPFSRGRLMIASAS